MIPFEHGLHRYPAEGSYVPWHPGIPEQYRNHIVPGDMRHLLANVPMEGVDLVLTDPPYNIGYKRYDIYEDNMPTDEYIQMLSQLRRFRKVAIIHYPEEMIRFVVPALGNPDHIGAWCYNTNVPRRYRLISYYGGVPNYSLIRQPYKNPMDKRVRSYIERGSVGAALYEWWDDIQLVKNVSKEKGAHPCPVPVKLMERIILLTTAPGDVILDPFAGGGTTAVAAKRLGRRFVGFELSPNYARAANERVALTQVSLCVEG